MGVVEANTRLNVGGIKPVIISDLEDALQTIKGESVSIKVRITGKPRPDVTWLKDDKRLAPNNTTQITASTTDNGDAFTLTILNVQPSDQGEYFARITNSAGSIKSKKCTVIVTSK